MTDIAASSTSFDFSSSLDLMTYEGSTVSTVEKDGILTVVDTVNPEQSLVLKKTVPGAVHGGGSFWDNRALDYMAIQQWVKEGALKN